VKIESFKKEELHEMHEEARLDKCPLCGHYHKKQNKASWPQSNVSICDACKKEKEGNKRGI